LKITIAEEFMVYAIDKTTSGIRELRFVASVTTGGRSPSIEFIEPYPSPKPITFKKRLSTNRGIKNTRLKKQTISRADFLPEKFVIWLLKKIKTVFIKKIVVLEVPKR